MSTNTGTPRVIPNLEACIDCGGCEVACKRTWELPEDSDRIRVVTVDEGSEGASTGGGERSAGLNCYHCAKAPCKEVCPTEAIERSDNGLIRVNKDDCIGCAYCAVVCPFGAPQFPAEDVPEPDESHPRGYGAAGLMDKCTGCEPRIERDQLPACVEGCPTDALVYGTPAELSAQIREGRLSTPFTEAELAVVFGDDGLQEG